MAQNCWLGLANDARLVTQSGERRLGVAGDAQHGVADNAQLTGGMVDGARLGTGVAGVAASGHFTATAVSEWATVTVLI